MQYGFSVPTRGEIARPENLATIVRRAEALGFAFGAVPDHVIIPRTIGSTYPYTESGKPNFANDCLEQITLIAYLAGLTKTLRLMTGVMVVPHRPAVLAAKQLATIDVLTGGRLTVGCGAGWLEEEFVALGTPPFAERGKATAEYIAAFRELWTKENPHFDGQFVKFSDLHFDPKPVQKPHPPIWTGGESGPALRRAATIADGWFPIGNNPKAPLDTAERYAAGVAKLRMLAKDAGRDPAKITLAYYSVNYAEEAKPAQGGGTRQAFSGSWAEIRDDVKRFGDIGAQHLMFNLRGPDTKSTVAILERVAANVIAKG